MVVLIRKIDGELLDEPLFLTDENGDVLDFANENEIIVALKNLELYNGNTIFWIVYRNSEKVVPIHRKFANETYELKRMSEEKRRNGLRRLLKAIMEPPTDEIKYEKIYHPGLNEFV